MSTPCTPEELARCTPEKVQHIADNFNLHARTIRDACGPTIAGAAELVDYLEIAAICARAHVAGQNVGQSEKSEEGTVPEDSGTVQELQKDNDRLQFLVRKLTDELQGVSDVRPSSILNQRPSAPPPAE